MSSDKKKTKTPKQKSFAEALITEAFTPGVRPQSFDAVNIVLGALLVCLLAAIVLDYKNTHLYGLAFLTLGLGFLMNKYVFMPSIRMT